MNNTNDEIFILNSDCKVFGDKSKWFKDDDGDDDDDDDDEQ